MSIEGPSLDSLVRRLAETPAIFLEEPRIRQRGAVDCGAVIGDLLLALDGAIRSNRDVGRFRPTKVAERNLARLQLICAWLLHDDGLRRSGVKVALVQTLLIEGLAALAAIIDAERFVTDPERREELVRLVLQWLQLRPAGESVNQAADRLKALDSVERERVIRESRARAEADRARKLRAEMAAREAREAAAKANREW